MEPPSKIPFHERIYDLYVILGAPNAQEMWNWEIWNKATQGLAPFVSLARDKTAIRTTQFIKDSNNTVSFGRIAWSEKGHQKWTHGSPATVETSRGWSFLQMEMWTPAWTICEREHCAPDVFFAFRNEAFWPRTTPLRFNQTILFAVSTTLGDDVLRSAHEWVLQLSVSLNSPLVAYQKRPWGKPLGISGGFSDSIQDMMSVGLFKVGDYQKRPVDLDTFQEKWESLHPA